MEKIRYLSADIENLCFDSGQMAFISGPRQVGKTTFAKALLAEREIGNYYNWDEVKFRRLWTKDPTQIFPIGEFKNKPLIILDEIYKAKLWKRNLKGIYDTLENPCDIIVPDKLLDLLFDNNQEIKPESQYLLMTLNKFGGFPWPLLAQSQRKLNLWQCSRTERLIREDLRDLSRLPE